MSANTPGTRGGLARAEDELQGMVQSEGATSKAPLLNNFSDTRTANLPRAHHGLATQRHFYGSLGWA